MHHLAEYAEGLCSVFDCPLAWNRFTLVCPLSLAAHSLDHIPSYIYIYTVYVHISLYKLKNIDTILYLAYLGIPLYHPQPSAEILSAFGAPWAAGRPQNLRAQFL